MSAEILLACPLCLTPNFTPMGLRAHFCKEVPPEPGSNRKRGKLPPEVWRKAVDEATRQWREG
jgi:hypothetical protein